MKKGAFIFVLHSHLPYVRKKGKWPHGEEMVYEAMAETYIPLLNALHDLLKDGYHPHLTISLTPILLEQLNDAYMKKEFVAYLESRIKACRNDVKIYSGPKVIKDLQDRKHHQELAKFYLDFYLTALHSFKTRYKKDLIKAFKELQDNGTLDIITSSATHAYLPLFYDENSINEQLKVGINTYKKYLGVAPRGIWLPECGYRPLVKDPDHNTVFQGFEEYLEKYGLQYFFTDSHVFSSASHISIREMAFIGPYNFKEVKYETEEHDDGLIEKPTYKPYTVSKSKVSVFARDTYTSLQVWSGDFGYPGDYDYREFHAKDAISGLQYCRITNHDGLGGKQLYEPERAHNKVLEHASHFASLVEGRINDIYNATGKDACIVSSYDTELFGHWWFEGVEWLKEVMKKLEKSETVELTNADRYIGANPPGERIAIPESSWGLGGGHFVWMNENTSWMWPIIHDLSARVKQASVDMPQAKGIRKTILNQALRELLLLHSSDWPFLVTTVQAKEYAIERFMEHQQRLEKLLNLAYKPGRLNDIEKTFVKQVCDTDNPFKDLDYTQFGKKVDMQ